MRPTSIALPLFALALASVLPSRASACSCVFLPDFPTAYAQSHTIFLGEVTGVETASPEYSEAVWVTFTVETDWKGVPPATVRVLTGAHDGVCGVGFVPGERYLVYALAGGTLYGPLPPGEVWTHSCWRTHGAWPEDPDIPLLNAITPVLPPSWGSLKIRYR